ncbi:MAG: FHA domain-containing protein, partial [Bdellovibrionales bacterium]|nr:FHA domain-containing protein [Bdellovibrionales bacterium]
MAVIIVVSRPDRPQQDELFIEINRKLIFGNSMYCDVVLGDKMVANMQFEILAAKTGHIIVKNLDAKKELHLNQARLLSLKKTSIKADDVLKVGPFVLRIDPTKLTQEELAVL